MIRAAVAGVVLALGVAAPASASFTLAANPDGARGRIVLIVFSSKPVAKTRIFERVGKEKRLIATTALKRVAPFEGGEPRYAALLPDKAVWKCTRRNRHFVATGAGGVRGAYSVRTPSCTNRLVLRARPGRVTVTDSWGKGGITATVCAPSVCREVRLERYQTSRTVRMPVRRGDRLTMRGQYQRTSLRVGRRPGGGPVILTTGDSLMQNLGVILADRLRSSARPFDDSRAGATVTTSFGEDWRDIARAQVARLHPRVAIVFIGTNDTGPIAGIPCCDVAWGAEYERRVRTVMATYAQRGAGEVVWLTVPYSRDLRRHVSTLAVNAALHRAADAVPGVSLVPVDELFTPQGRYRARLDGVRVREPDGIHLSLAGARIAARSVLRRLRRLDLK